jgi:hypothetical protein
MANLNLKAKVRHRPWHANDTEMNHLAKAGLVSPEKISRKLERQFISRSNMYNPMQAYADANPSRVQKMTQDVMEWELMGASDRPLVVVRDLEPANLKKGLGKSPFDVMLDTNWYKVGDVIAPANKRYLLRVQQPASKVGGAKGYKYTVVFHEDDKSLFLPNEYLRTGAKFSKLFSTYGEGSDSAGSVHFAMPFSLRTQTSKIKKEYKITGDAASKGVLEIALMDANNKVHESKWINYADAEFKAQFAREREFLLWYGRESNSTPDTTGRPVRTGAGIEQLMESGHMHYYNKLSTKLIQEYLEDIFYNRVGFNSRHVQAYTGEYGAAALHRALESDASKFLTMDTSIINDAAGSEFNKNAKEFGRQFVRYRGINGVVFDINHNPCYDDTSKQWLIDPVTGKPAESQKFTFFDLSDSTGGGNLEILQGEKKSGYVSGLTSPYGANRGEMMSNSEDAYTMIEQEEAGVKITDVSRCGQLRLSISK